MKRGMKIPSTILNHQRSLLKSTNGGVLSDGTRVLPESWMEESTEPSPASEGYGYLWWRLGDGAYAAVGIFGQMMWVDPPHDLVVVTQVHSPRPHRTSGRDMPSPGPPAMHFVTEGRCRHANQIDLGNEDT